jgi:hypothetical protein
VVAARSESDLGRNRKCAQWLGDGANCSRSRSQNVDRLRSVDQRYYGRIWCWGGRVRSVGSRWAPWAGCLDCGALIEVVRAGGVGEKSFGLSWGEMSWEKVE